MGECVDSSMAIMIMPNICEVLDSVVKLSFALMCSNKYYCQVAYEVFCWRIRNFINKIILEVYSIFKNHAQFSKALHSDTFQNTKKNAFGKFIFL